MDRHSLRRVAPPAEQPTIIGEFKRLNEIGKGSFAMVYRGVHAQKGSLVAIKSVNVTKLSKKLQDNLEAEVKILRDLHHPHIVALFDCRRTKVQVHLVMEFCELGDLSLFIKKRSSLSEHEATKDMIQKYPLPAVGGLNEVVVRHFVQQIASALEFMRVKDLLHRDIKPQNLLLVPSRLWYEKNQGRTAVMIDEKSIIPARGIESLPILKIADFGFARFLPSLELAETLCGSPLYMAPEILRYERYDAKADLWSVGTVLHEMMVGKPPFRASNHVELLKKIEQNDDRIKFPAGLVISSGMKKLIRSLLKRNPTERVAYEVFFHDEVVISEIPGLVGEDRPREPLAQNLASRISRTRPSETLSSSPKTRHLDPEISLRSEAPHVPSSSRPSRPSSRVETYHTPPKGSPIEDRRLSTEAQYNVPRERRPTLTSAATAPAKTQEKAVSAATVERRNSRATPPPGTSMLKEHLDRERGRIPDERSQREARERAAQDIAFERDYVLVEKRQVEVNAFADELALSPHVGNTQGAMVRRATTAGVPLSSTAPVSNQTRQGSMQVVGRQGTVHQRGGSYERRYGRSPTSATSAISKALNMANFRLFGMGFSPPTGKGPSPPPQGYAPFPTYPTEQSSMLMIGAGTRTMDSRDDDTRTKDKIEDLAQRSHVVWGFADVKYQQLLPSRPISSHGLGMAEGRKGRQFPEAVAVEEPDLPADQVLVIAEEALVLLVKVLAILTKIMSVSAAWFRHSRADVGMDSPRSAPTKSTNATAAAVKINQVVQWARTQFNDGLEKSEFVSRKLVDAQKQLPLDHPGHPSNHPEPSEISGGSVATSTDQVMLTTGITAEKLMYDRALEMSRTAAVNELTHEDFEGSELSYRTAIWMLEAILDNDDDRSFQSKSNSKQDENTDEDLINGLESEDRATVKKLLEGLRIRLHSIQKKIHAQKQMQAKRSSVASTPSGYTPPNRFSPAATPQLANTPPR
ncbi:hypothetical protein FKW77_004522 [Venturia effusa]|uniref:non-specific serine/threonine protein kinase n=1 Tax=Venturia effusa TaxID=50376 RepID=A0A517KW79_9PEZI|nr:hypothetical protein FKW77_004522 [Venturia effusa]